MEKLYARLLVVSQHRYINLSDMWERTAGKPCSVHIMYLWEGVQTNSVKCTTCIQWIPKRCSSLCGDLSLLADGFMRKRCDGTIQEADLAVGLVVDGETCGCVKSFSYLGDTLLMDMVDARFVKSSIIYGSETRPLLADVGLKFEREEMQIIRWMCDATMKDRKN